MDKPLPRYIYDIPYSNYMNLCRALDLGEGWKILAGALDYKMDYIHHWQNAMCRPGGSCADEMLKDYSHRNPTPTQLFYLLKANKLMRALETLRGCVPGELFEELDRDKLKSTKKPEETKSDKCKHFEQHTDGDTDNTIYVHTEELPLPDPNTNYGPTSNYNKQMPYDKVLFEAEQSSDLWSAPCDTKTYHQPPGSVASTCGDGQSNVSTSPAHSPASPAGQLGHGPVQYPGNYMHATGQAGEAGDNRKHIKNMQNNSHHGNIASTSHFSTKDAALSLAHHYSYAEIKLATNNFDTQNLLGQGGFGSVYKARLDRSGHVVAVKVLSQVKEDFQEVELLMKYSHDNVISLHGYSRDGPKICILYQYMENGSLEDMIGLKHGQNPLSWQQRTHILHGVACGLRYLHSTSPRPLIHGDIKSANILLDHHLDPKVSDFGLARMATGGSNPGIYTHYTQASCRDGVYGSKAYLPIEFFENNFQLHLGTDTFSFGVVVYETCTGMKPLCPKRKPAEKYLYSYIGSLYEGMSPAFVLQEVRDMLAGWPEALYLELMDLGHQCTAERRSQRPDMAQVHEKLGELMDKIQQKAYQRPPSVPGSEQSYHFSHHSQGQGHSVTATVGPLQLQMEYDRRNLHQSSGTSSLSPQPHTGQPPQSYSQSPDFDTDSMTSVKALYSNPQSCDNQSSASPAVAAQLNPSPPSPCSSAFTEHGYYNVEAAPPRPPRMPKQRIYANVNGTLLDNPENFNYTESLENMENEKRTPSGTDMKRLQADISTKANDVPRVPKHRLSSSPVAGHRLKPACESEYRDIRCILQDLRPNLHSAPPPQAANGQSLLPDSMIPEDDTRESIVDIKDEYLHNYVSDHTPDVSFRDPNHIKANRRHYSDDENEVGTVGGDVDGRSYSTKGHMKVYGDGGGTQEGNTDDMDMMIASKRGKALPLGDDQLSNMTAETADILREMMKGVSLQSGASDCGQATDSLASASEDLTYMEGLRSLNIADYLPMGGPAAHVPPPPPRRLASLLAAADAAPSPQQQVSGAYLTQEDMVVSGRVMRS